MARSGMGGGTKGHDFGGFDKEPPQPHGPRLRGKQPVVHSHSKHRTRKVAPPRKATSKSSI